MIRCRQFHAFPAIIVEGDNEESGHSTQLTRYIDATVQRWHTAHLTQYTADTKHSSHKTQLTQSKAETVHRWQREKLTEHTGWHRAMQTYTAKVT